MQGQVVKIISNQFFVLVGSDIITCSQRGKLKQERTMPLVGDKVIIDSKKRVIEKILPRKNELIRPRVANIDQAFVITSYVNPDFSTNLLDKLIVELELNNIKPIICLTKRDLLIDDVLVNYQDILAYYKNLGYSVIENFELDKIKDILENKVTAFIGQTGAGKSTLLNNLFPGINLKTNEVSLALGRGRHTTRHIEIINISNIKVLDTPGFSALTFPKSQKSKIKDAFIEFQNFPCLYRDCMHDKEGECMVKVAVLEGKILKSRYENYIKFLNDTEGGI